MGSQEISGGFLAHTNQRYARQNKGSEPVWKYYHVTLTERLI